jgi:hypothetical protein
MAWQSLPGMGGGNNAGGGGNDGQQAQPQGTEYTLQGRITVDIVLSDDVLTIQVSCASYRQNGIVTSEIEMHGRSSDKR